MLTSRGILSNGRAFSLLLLLLCLAPAWSVPQAADNTILPPSCQREEGQCTAAGSLDSAGELPFAVSDLPKTREHACVISIADAQRKRREEQATFIDVRRPEHFQSYHIPGSLNMPLHAIKTKGFFKNTPMILVNEGRTSLALEQTCHELRQQGFAHVTVLDGGLHAWHEAQGELVGDVVAQRPLHYVTPEELFAEHGSCDWLVLDFSDGQRRNVYPWLPKNIESMGQVEALSSVHIAAWRATVERHRQLVPHLKVLVVSDSEGDYGPITAAVRQARLETVKVFYLGFGLKGYEDFLTKHLAMWNHKNQPFRWPPCQG